jgi:hypothetical protein
VVIYGTASVHESCHGLKISNSARMKSSPYTHDSMTDA